MLLGQLYCKHSKILNTFHSVLKEKLNIGLEFTKNRIANREDPDQPAVSALSRPFWQAASVRNL